MNPIITSLLQTDLYKLSMQQTFLHHMPGNMGRYEFVCRNDPLLPLARLESALNEQLDALCSLRLRDEELDYLSTLRYLKPDYIEFLRLFQLNRRFIKVSVEGDGLSIVAQGPQLHAMAFEIFTLAIVNELYTRQFETPELVEDARRRLNSKIDAALDRLGKLGADHDRPSPVPFELVDFGLRRRHGAKWQEEVVRTLMERMPGHFRGTSNVDLARRLKLVPTGTMAHEYLQTFQAMPGVQLRYSQQAALETWTKEFRGDLGIALTDVITTDAFLADFDLYFAKLFDGVRHDSGDPIEWANKILAHYEKLGIDPASKRLVFSDGLTLDKALDIYEQLSSQHRIRLGFGIGTSLTNDTQIGALNIVMKLTACNGHAVAKISDAPGKTLCNDQTFLNYLKQQFNVA